MMVSVMRAMNDMVLVKQHYLMEIHTKDNMKMEKEMERELIDFQMVLVI